MNRGLLLCVSDTQLNAGMVLRLTRHDGDGRD